MIVAVRAVVAVFADAVAVIVPSLLPEVGLNVNQAAELVAVHETLPVTVTVLLSPAAI